MAISTALRQAPKKQAGSASTAKAGDGPRSRKVTEPDPGGLAKKKARHARLAKASGSKSRALANASPAKAAYMAAAKFRSQDSSIEARRISDSSPDQVIALMKSAGILTAAGKLTRSFK